MLVGVFQLGRVDIAGAHATRFQRDPAIAPLFAILLEYVLEENREQGSYRWVTLETRRVCTGYVNPPELEDADKHHERVLELAPYHLDFSSIDCEAMDVLFAFDFTYTGNHDEVVVEALGLTNAL